MNNKVMNRWFIFGRGLRAAICIGLAGLLLPVVAQAQISLVDTVGQAGLPITITEAASPSVTLPNFVVTPGTNKVLVVLVECHGGNPVETEATPSWGATPMVLAGMMNNTTTAVRGTAIFYLFNPAPGTNSITVMTASSSVDTEVSAYTLGGVDTNTPPLYGGSGAGSSANPTFTIPNVVANSWAAVNSTWASTGGTLTFTATGGTPQINNVAEPSTTDSVGYFSNLSPGSVVFSATYPNSQKYNFAAAVFAPQPIPTPPFISIQPQSNVVVFAGITLNLSVTAAGTAPLAYQWMRNGTNLVDSAGYLSGSLTNVLTITGISAADAAANYQVIVSNSLGSTNSNFESVTVVSPNGAYEAAALTNNPFVFYTFSETGDPQSGNVTAYDSMGSFNGTYGAGGVADNGGSGAFNGANGTTGPQAGADGLTGFPDTNTALGCINNNFPLDSYAAMPAFNLNHGAGANVLTITAWIYPEGEQTPAAGVVFSRSGTTTAGLNFSSQTNGDGYSTGVLNYTWNNDGATYGWNSGLTPPQYTWSLVSLVITPTNATIYILNNSGLAFSVNNYTNPPQKFEGPTLIGVDSLASVRNFTGKIDEVALFNQSLTQNQLISLFAAASGTTLAPPVPSIVTEPTWTPSPLYPGEPASATVTAIEATSYRWMAGVGGVYTNLTDGPNLSGSATSTLTISNTQPANALDYIVVASSVTGSVTSAPPATIVLNATGPAMNFTLDLGGAAIFQGINIDWNSSTNWNPGGLPASASQYANPGSSYEVVPGAQLRSPQNGPAYITFPGAKLTIDGNGIFTNVAAAGETTVGQLKFKEFTIPQTNYYPLLVMAGGELDNGGDNGGLFPSTIVIQGTINIISNTPIYVDTGGSTLRPYQIDAFLEGNGGIEYHDFSNDFSGCLDITGNTNTYSGTWNIVQGPLVGSGNKSLGTNTITIGANGVLETSYPINNTNALLILNGKMFLTQADTFKAAVINGRLLAPGTYSAMTLNTTYPGNFPTNFTALYGTTVSNASGSITVLSTNVAPLITTQPQAVSIYQGQTATFSVAAAGGPPLDYQWYTNGTAVLADNANRTGSTSNFLRIPVAALADAGNYSVVVTSAFGSVTSSVARLTVLPTGPATTFTLNYPDTNGVSANIVQPTGADWNSVSNWSPLGLSAAVAAVAYPGSTFELLPGSRLRSPTAAATFPGVQLILDGSGILENDGTNNLVTGTNNPVNVSELRFKNNDAANYFSSLVLNGGQIDVGNAGTLILQGNMTVANNSTLFVDNSAPADRSIRIDSQLAGSGNLLWHNVSGLLSGNSLWITGIANTFNGQWIVDQGALIGAGANALGTNNIIVGTNGQNAAVETLYNINNTNGSLILGANGQMFLHQSDTFASVVINGTALTNGLYLFSQLNSSYPANFPATWALQAGSTITSGSGWINVGNVFVAPPPTPRITSIGLSGTTLSISATNGLPGGSWILLHSTNIALPLSQWQVDITGTFDSRGNVSTNILNSATNQQEFYLLKQ